MFTYALCLSSVSQKWGGGSGGMGSKESPKKRNMIEQLQAERKPARVVPMQKY